MRLKTREGRGGIVGLVYTAFERALWALAPILLVVGLLSFPSQRAAHQQEEERLSNEIASENVRFCEKWGMLSGSTGHTGCINDLVGIRARTEQLIRNQLAADF